MTADVIRFINERIRPAADLLAGVMPLPESLVSECLAKGVPAGLGIDPALLTQEAALQNSDYAGVPADLIEDGSPADGRTPISARDVLALLRIYRFLGLALSADPNAVTVIRKIAVNPRA